MATGKKERRLRAAQKALAILAGVPPAELLPMPVKPTSTKVSLDELAEYRERVRRHVEHFPEYQHGWHRPTRKTAELVWETWMAGETFELVQAQALVVAWGVGVLAAQRGTLLTVNAVLDAVASCWSHHYRACVEAGRAHAIRQMRPETIRAAQRDLVRNGLRLEVLWNLALRNPFITTKRVVESGYRAAPADRLPWFVAAVEADPEYRWPGTGRRLLFEHDSMPAMKDRAEYAAEWAYNVVTSGERARRVMRLLQDVRLVFDGNAFARDHEAVVRRAAALRETLRVTYSLDADAPDIGQHVTLRGGPHAAKQVWVPSERQKMVRQHVPKEHRPAAYRLLAEYDEAHAGIVAQRGVYEQAQTIEEDEFGQRLAVIKTAVQRDINRRYSYVNFWPSSARTKIDRAELGGFFAPETEDDPPAGPREIETAQRARWFRFGGFSTTYGLDVSSSQTQIIAVLVGSEDLERVATAQTPLKQFLAQAVWESGLCPRGYSGPGDDRLVAFMKALWMRVGYGSRVEQVLLDLAREPSVYGPSWIGYPVTSETLKAARARVVRLLNSIPGYDDLNVFLTACQRIARIADPYEGVILVDPFDGERVRWNSPVLREQAVSVGDKMKVYIRAPRGVPNAQGDYPVDRKELVRKVAPCLVHMCDASYNGLVIEALARRGVENLYAVHDLWAVPDAWRQELRDSLHEAGEAWLRGLGPVYDRIEYYLSQDREPKFCEYARGLRAAWEARVREGRWPRFAVAEARIQVVS